MAWIAKTGFYTGNKELAIPKGKHFALTNLKTKPSDQRADVERRAAGNAARVGTPPDAKEVFFPPDVGERVVEFCTIVHAEMELAIESGCPRGLLGMTERVTQELFWNPQTGENRAASTVRKHTDAGFYDNIAELCPSLAKGLPVQGLTGVRLPTFTIPVDRVARSLTDTLAHTFVAGTVSSGADAPWRRRRLPRAPMPLLPCLSSPLSSVPFVGTTATALEIVNIAVSDTYWRSSAACITQGSR